MAEGLQAVITADTSSYLKGINDAVGVSVKFETAAQKAARGAMGLGVAVDASAKKAKPFTDSFNAAGQALKGMAAKAANSGRSVGMAGIQIQQFAGQVQAGTSASVALSQQAADLGFVLGFPLLGAVVGLAAGLAGPLISSLVDTGESTDTLRDKMTQLAEETGKVADITANLALFNFNAQMMEAAEGAENARLEVERLNKELDERRAASSGRLSEDQDPVIKNLKNQIALQEDLIDIENNRASVASDNIDKVFTLQAAADAKELENQQAKQDKITNLILDSEAKRAELRFGLISATEGLELEAETLKHEKRLAIIADAFTDEFEKTAEHNAVLEAEDQRHEQAISDIFNKGAADRLKMERQVQDGISKMRASAVNNGVALLNQFAGKSKAAAIAAVVLSKGLMIAQTMQSTAAAELRAMAELGPIAGPPAAASIRAWGTANVALIAATGLAQVAGGGGGGSGSAAGVSSAVQSGQAQAAQAPESSIVNINLEGESFGRQSVVGLIEQINEAVADGARINIA